MSQRSDAPHRDVVAEILGTRKQPIMLGFLNVSLGTGPAQRRWLRHMLIDFAARERYALGDVFVQSEAVQPAAVDELRRGLLSDLTVHEQHQGEERRRLQQQADTVRRDRINWAENAMDGVIPDDITRDKQAGLLTRLHAVEGQLERLAVTGLATRELIEQALTLAEHVGTAYQRADMTLRQECS